MGVTRIQHNLSAMNAMSNYQGNQKTLTGNLEKLSSGYRINSAADDAAGLAISEKMRSQIAGLEKAQDNANDGISLIQTAEGALTEVNSMLTRLKTLATQSANGTYDDGIDRANLQEETNALLDEIDRISQSTNFNGINLLDGSMNNSGIKQTNATVNVNGIALSQTKSEDGVATQFKVSLADNDRSVEGDSQTFKFNYTDEQGVEKSSSITFEAGADKAATTKNLAEAINKNSVLGKHFTASVNDDNDLVMTSNIKAAAATGSDITTGASKVSNVQNVSDKASLSIESQKAITSYAKLSDKLYSEDGTEIKNSRQLERAVEGGQKLYTDITSDGNASIVSNEVTNSDLKLTRTAGNLTSDTTFTLTKSASLDATRTSAAMQGVELTDEGKAIQSDTVFTFTSANKSGGTASGTIALTNKAYGLTSDVTFTFSSAALGSVSEGLTVTSANSGKMTSISAGDLKTDTTFTFNAAEVSSNGTTGVTGAELTAKGRALTADTTFTFTGASLHSTGTSSNELGSVTLQEAGRKLAANSGSSTKNITFTYTSASVKEGDATIQGAGAASSTLTVTSAGRALTDDYTFEFVSNRSTWIMYRTGDTVNRQEAEGVDIDKYIQSTAVSLNKTAAGSTNLVDGDRINITAGYWKTDDASGAAFGLTKTTDREGNEIYNVGDGRKYFSYTTANSMAGGETIEIGTSFWKDNSGNEYNATQAAEYFSVKDVDDGGKIKVDKSYWKSSNASLAATGDGKLDATEAGNYIGTVTSLGATESGQSVTIIAQHWQANDTSLGDNGNVGNGLEYFSGQTDEDGKTIAITGGKWNAVGDDVSGQIDDISKYINGAEAAFKNGTQIALKMSGEWTMKNTNDEEDEGEVVNISDYITNDLSNVNLLEAGDINIKGSTFTLSDEDEAVKDVDYTATADKTASKSYDLSSLNDGDRIQINGTNYTYRANESDVQKASDFHTGSQLAAMSQAITMGTNTDPEGNGLNDIKVKDQFAAGEALSLQVGDTADDYQRVGVTIQDMSAQGLGLRGLDISTQEGAAAAIDTIKTAVNTVSTQRGKLGALQNRLDHTLNNLDATTQNITAAESQIRDVDMAKEMTQYSKNNILVQAAQSMLAQANSLPQGVLSLLQ